MVISVEYHDGYGVAMVRNGWLDSLSEALGLSVIPQIPSKAPLLPIKASDLKTMLRRLVTFAAASAGLAAASATSGSSWGFGDLSTNDSDVIGTVTEDRGYDGSSTQQTSHIQAKIRSGDVKSRGVNLGGWLVAEHWMTGDADFWKGVNEDDAGKGEYTAITKAADPDTVRSNLDYHHSTFITETEIAAIADAGLNTVRVPVGYWIPGFDNDDPSGAADWEVFSNGTIKYLDLLIQDWAKTHNLAVLISIHAAKGSQNGADHSSPCSPGNPYWSEFDENVDNTVHLASFLADRYKDEGAFLGIGLLNEPNGSTDEDKLYAYYEKAYAAIREFSDCVLSVSPLLYKQAPDVMNGFMEAPAYTNVWVEWHRYFVWGYETTSESDLLTVAVQTNYQNDMNAWNSRSSHNRLFIGEWSFATAGKFSDDQQAYYEFARAQVDVMNQAEGGWTFWSWRIYGDEEGFNAWSLRSVLRDDTLKSIVLSDA